MGNRAEVNARAGLKHELCREFLGLDWYDTESQARRVIEALAEAREQLGADDQQRSDNAFYMAKFKQRLCAVATLEPDEVSWFEIVDVIEQEFNRVLTMLTMVREREWAEHVGKGPFSGQVELAFTQLHNELAAKRDVAWEDVWHALRYINQAFPVQSCKYLADEVNRRLKSEPQKVL